jgi:MFS family permease
VPPGAAPLWRNRPFALFWVAQLLSNVGTQVSELAIPLTAVLVLSASPAQMGVLTALEAAPSLLLALVLGVLVDRVRRASLLIWCNIGQAALLASVPLAALLGVLTLPQLYAVTFLVAGLALAYTLAHVAYLPVLVDDRRFAAANSAVQVSDSVTAVAGPGVAGVLVQLLGAPIAVAVDAGSFVLAALPQLIGRRPEPAAAPIPPLRASIGQGWTAFRANRAVWALTAGKGTFDFFHWGMLALFVLYAVRELQLSPALIGLVATLGAIGPLLAGLVAAPVMRRFGTARTSVIAALLLGGNVLIPLAAGPTWVVVGVLAVANALVGLGVVYLIIVRTTVLQRTVPAAMLGRVGAVIRLIEWGPGPVGGLLGGLLGELLGLRAALLVIGVGGVLGVGWVLAAATRQQ